LKQICDNQQTSNHLKPPQTISNYFNHLIMNELAIQGRVIRRTDAGFDEAVMATLFNKRDYGRRPELIAVPKTVEDVVAIVKYAKANDKKVSVCSGGHSWSANHLREGSLLIDMGHFNQFDVNKDAMTATAGPGVGGSVLLLALFKQGLFFPAGHCKGVCIGGYLLQGGFGWNGRRLGMACESVIGLDIVTADGELLHANEKENSDLYWAARGSGGGFFGVVVRFHLRLYKRPAYIGNMMHVFKFKHLEEVLQWAYEVGPSVPDTVEFQMLFSKKTVGFMGPGIEAVAPIFAETKTELEAARAFLEDSPVRKKAFFRTPFINTGVKIMYDFAMTHYPNDHHWGVDNMWTNASLEELVPYIKGIVETLPPPPAHLLWLNWYPPRQRPEMAFSMEDNLYLALYGAWKNAADTAVYGRWAPGWMEKMQHLATGIQLADEGLHLRTAPFVSNPHLQKLQDLRSRRDAAGRFHEWHSKPVV
jgi:hypothetical protein